jgi:hypothetical protein
MTTPLVSFGIDTPDPAAAARWWAEVLGWAVVAAAEDEVELVAPDGRPPALVFLRVTDPKRVKDRIHLDLGSDDADAQRRTVDRLLAAGARPVDIGQGDVGWRVLADPDGHEFCVLDPRDRYRGAPLGAIVIDAHDPPTLARWWADVTGWPVGYEEGDVTSLHQPDDRPPDIDFVRVGEPKTVKNRVHPDVVALSGDVDAVARELISLGARAVDIGQGDVSWRVLADPEGNELCVLPPGAAPSVRT